MDFLKKAVSQEVEKRKNLYKRAREDSSSNNAEEKEGLSGDESAQKKKKKLGGKRYVRVGDLNSTQDADAEEEEAAAAATSEQKKKQGGDSQLHNSNTAHVLRSKGHRGRETMRISKGKDRPAEAETKTEEEEEEGEDGQPGGGAMSAEEIVKRLRARAEPIRLFGETDAQRRQRLRQLEVSEEKRGISGQQNEFRRALAQVEAGAMLEDLKRQSRTDDTDGEDVKRQRKYRLLMDHDVSAISLDLLRTDANQLHTLLYVYLKRLLYEWDDYLATRPDDERRTAEGKLAAATQRQSAEYLRPLFRSIKARTVPADVLARITEIARNVLDREYMKANDAYLQLAVGNAPWPVGVTQVGIHARAARENINANKVAHVLNNEVQRKWIQSLKRLMRFAQTKYPPADLAKMMG
ncbi:hypothetical protein H4217_002912 [Coemansia sp. RSA 1939]|nr:hypothetical protein H4217_002912 [Coemansia sp. RSA 1939]KAJ2610717.1 hypothetical protein EV177_003836 [Coemansia sp. RSA 1804]